VTDIHNRSATIGSGDSMIQIDREQLGEIAQQFGLDLIVLFGSHTKGRVGPGSDVDVAVRAIQRPWGDWNWECEVANALSAVVQVGSGEIDIVFLNGASPLLMFEVARSGRVLYEKEWDTFSEFRSYAARVYYDNEPRFRRQAQYLKERFA
jgi:predicted nucleotidyltransferase